jgi:DNA-binding CsgD family transcriptional regulator
VDIDPNPLFYQDRVGRLWGCNRSFEQMIGKPKYDVIGKMADEIFKKKVADAVTVNFKEVLKSHVTNRFITLVENQLQIIHSFLVTMTYSVTEAGEELVVSSLTDVSFMSSNVVSNSDHFGVELNLTRTLGGHALSSHMELSMCSDRIKNQVIEWLDVLRGHLSEDGKNFLASIMTKLRSEFTDGVDFISERLFDEKHQALYDILSRQSINLTKHEMRLCALLSLNYSLVEISRLTRRSTNSVNVAFNRIRAKLSISGNDDLKYFLRTLSRADSLSTPTQK